MKLKKIISFMKNPLSVVVLPQMRWLSKYISDEYYLKILYEISLNEKLDLKQPKLFNEKLQWLKLNDRSPRYKMMVDKEYAKQYVAEIIGKEHIIQTYGVWNCFDEINFDILPNQFVLKCTHDSASVIICENKEVFDKNIAKQKIEKCLKKNHYYAGREWAYKDIQPRIIAEEYLKDKKCEDLIDYKFFTFNGEPKIVHIVSNRQNIKEETYGDFFDMKYKHLEVTMGHPNAPVQPDKPKYFEKMIEFSKLLSQDTIHLRVDFYEANEKLYFGELTFYENAGFIDIVPKKWNEILGSWLEINM